MADDKKPTTLAPPAVTALKQEAVGSVGHRQNMERTVSQDMRNERADLKEAAEHSLNIIMDLDLEGKIRYVSPSWTDVIGSLPKEVTGKPVLEIICGGADGFADTIESVRKDDSRSHIARFTRAKSQLPMSPTHVEEEEDELLNPEAQGEPSWSMTEPLKQESHTIWILRPSIIREVTIDLPEVLVESLGVGAEVLAHYLTGLAEQSATDPGDVAPPLPVLCRICERQITPWWFEKHSELCLQEHRAEMDVQMAQETLSEHRNAIVKVLDTLESHSQRSRAAAVDSVPTASACRVQRTDYPFDINTIIGYPLQDAIPLHRRLRDQREHSERSTGFGHHRARSFAVRRPLARIVELVLNLCDTALEINTPAVKDNGRGPADHRDSYTVTAIGESHIASSSILAGSQEQRSTLLLASRRVLEYSERLRIEFDILVQECIEAAILKAARIAAGEDTSSEYEQPEKRYHQTLTIPIQHLVKRGYSLDPSTLPSSMAQALRNTSDASLPARQYLRPIKDFEIIKPISKGAFGSVYLAKKKSTGEYYAIKVLKKADMVAKNQVTNVKAERAIMMWQGESDFVAKLYWTFSSKDYLYLVMEYLNGGDCASLIKVLGALPEDWAKKYLAEVVLGVEHLHSRSIVHRDLKPDNLLIDGKGHLKLTDFGLSRMGMIGRQKRALKSVEPAPDLL
ncbi:unnamed protein product [Alternaria alternata]